MELVIKLNETPRSPVEGAGYKTCVADQRVIPALKVFEDAALVILGRLQRAWLKMAKTIVYCDGGWGDDFACRERRECGIIRICSEVDCRVGAR